MPGVWRSGEEIPDGADDQVPAGNRPNWSVASAPSAGKELIVSWESLERKKAELDDLIRNRIPQNLNDIAIARSYGDLRENFEYKSARDMEKYLAHRRNALDKEIDLARGTDFRAPTPARSTSARWSPCLMKPAGKSRYRSRGLGQRSREPSRFLYVRTRQGPLIGRETGDTVQIRDPNDRRHGAAHRQNSDPPMVNRHETFS